MIKVALVGIGGMGKVHYDVYKTLENCRVIAIADVNCEAAAEKAADSSVNIYKTLGELLEKENPDMVDICAPSYLHRELSITALNAGKHVLCEKPIALSVLDAEAVKKAAEKSGKLFMTAHVVRFMNAYIHLRKAVESKAFGELIRLDMKRISPIPRWSWENWMLDIEKSGGTPLDLGIHDLDFIQSIFGCNPDKYHSVYSKLKNDNDYFVSEMSFGNVLVTTETAWYNADIEFAAEYRAVFQNGYIEARNGDVTENHKKVDFSAMNTENQTVGLNIAATDGYKYEIEYFLSCIENNRAPQFVTLESTLNTMKLAEKLLGAAERRPGY